MNHDEIFGNGIERANMPTPKITTTPVTPDKPKAVQVDIPPPPKNKGTMSKFKRFLQGKTKAGQVVYGIVDALPIPNLLNPIRSALDNSKNVHAGQIIADAVKRLDPIRLVIGVIVSYFIITGKLTVETAHELIALLGTLI